jgi:hypothetical protein
MAMIPEHSPSPKKSKLAVWLLALLGLVLVNIAVHSFVTSRLTLLACALLAAGVACLSLALWSATKR